MKLNKEVFKIADNKIEEYRRCNVKELLNIEFKQNSFKDVEMDFEKNFKDYHLENFNILIFENNSLKLNSLEDKISFEKEHLKIEENIEKPILIINYFEDEKTYFKKSLSIEVSKNIQVSVLELFISNSNQSFIDEFRDFEVCKDSTLNYVRYQKLSTSDFMTSDFNPKIQSNAKLDFINFDYGANKAYNNIFTDLFFETSFFKYESLIDIKENQEIANIAKTIHNEKNTKSQVEAHHILDGNSHGVFEVKSVVNKKGVGSDIIQNSKTTLLSDDSSVNANPRLEIFIDDLKASHGATTSSLDEDALFYLQTRGLSYKEASKILLDSIKEKIINKILDERVKGFIKDL